MYYQLKQSVKKGLLLATVCLFALQLSAQKFQKIPYINNIQQYNINSGDIAKMRINIYAPVEENGVLRTKALADYPVEITFDSLGNRASERVYDDNGKISHINVWDYSVENNTVGVYKLNSYSIQEKKKTIHNNPKEKNVRVKHYAEKDTLLYEEYWMIGATGKTINYDLVVYEPKTKIIAQKTTKIYDVIAGKDIEYLVETLTGGDDYSWMPYFMDDWARAQNKNTQTEKFADGSQVIYTYDKKQKLFTEKNQIDPQGKSVKTTYKYEFDGNGNWTKATQFIDGKPIAIAIRTFEYRVKPIVVKTKK